MAMVACIVNTPSGGTYNVEVDDGATVLHLKKELEIIAGMPGKDQRLIHDASVLDNAVNLSDLAGPDSTVTFMLVRLPPIMLIDIANQNGLTLVGQDSVHRALAIAANQGSGSACLEALCHEHFDSGDPKSLVRPLHSLIQGGLAEALEELVDMLDKRQPGISPQAYVEALRLAAKRGLSVHCDVVLRSSAFKDANLDLTSTPSDTSLSKSCTPLHHAANDSVLRSLLQHQALRAVINYVDQSNSTCLHYATTEKACRTILECPFFSSVNTADSSGQTALHTARNPGVCRAILEDPSFTSIDAQDNNGCTALHLKSYSSDLLDVLLGAKANPFLVDKRGRTALHRARSRMACQLLLNAQVDANLKDSWGRTPLTLAADMRQNDVVMTLLESGSLTPDGIGPALKYALGLDPAVANALCHANGVELDSLLAPTEEEEQQNNEVQLDGNESRMRCIVQCILQ